VARKGRARRFREARELKQGFDDGLFAEGERTLADADADTDDEPNWRDEAEERPSDWDEDDPLRIDEGGRQAS
jgi:glycine/D-amino acid oxidase-like deaminating enzyme